tara:strand:- start:2144 stop:2815 length:672 start_codon:yes stop_codon:yes gene_type:complete
MMPQSISKKILIYLFILFTLTTITNNKISFDFYKVKEVNIIGLNHIEKRKLYNDFEIFKNNNIFLFNKEDISKIIYSNKTVEEFEIDKIYPSKLNIKIKKTKFLALTKKNGKDVLLGANGNMIEKNDDNYELPYIFGNIDINNFLYVKKIIDISPFEYENIKEFYYFKTNRWDILTKDGITLRMPSNLSIDKLSLIFKIINNPDFYNIKIFDFRQNNMLVINE